MFYCYRRKPYISQEHYKKTHWEEKSSNHSIAHFKYVFIDKRDTLKDTEEKHIHKCKNGDRNRGAVLPA